MKADTDFDCREMILEDDPRPENWPVAFYVCSLHKANCFADYDQAIVDEAKPCVICEPCDNDSLGG